MSPIFLEPVARNRDTGVAAPSYTSGAHMWNGAAAILKPYPAIIVARAITSPAVYPWVARAAAMSAMFVVPVRPNSIEIP